MEDSAGGEEGQDGELRENIYEEIEEQQEMLEDSRESSTVLHEVSSTSSTKPRLQKVLEAVTKRSSRTLEHGEQERNFPLSITEGRRRSMIVRATVDWDNQTEQVRLG